MAEALRNSTEIKQYLENNKKNVEATLLSEAVNVKDKIDEILRIGNIDLVTNAHRLIGYIIDGQEEELKEFAKQEGILWATHSIELTFKLEWVQAIRRTLWIFVEKFNNDSNPKEVFDFFVLEQKLNTRVDTFLNEFFLSYSTYKDSLILAHRQMVETLSVPIIPINASVCILPLIGSIDSFRTEILEEKVLIEIGESQIQTLIVDLSGIADMETEVLHSLMKIVDGASLMGCQTIITGLRAEVVKKMLSINVSIELHAKTLGTLQQALKEYVTL